MLRFLFASTITLFSAGCTVYVPLQPTMPLVQESKQAEVAVSLQPTVRVEAVGAYSPAPHVVLTGAGTVGLLMGGKNYLRTKQGEMGVGGYWNLGDKWLLSTLGGAGLAAVNRRGCLWGCGELQGSYYKLFGQVGVAYAGRVKTSILTYRLAHVHYSQVKHREKLLPQFGTYRHELGLTDRRRLGWNPDWFWQSTIGISFTNLDPPSSTPTAPLNQHDQWFAAGIPVLLFSFGIGWQPQL